jgi:hypothetical protein
MAIAFTYTKSTNTAVVTGGTSGTPATFANFVTADRAGSVTLLAATAGLSPTLALTYQITPVEKLALLISFVVASKTAQTDYIFITGTDAWDAAQTESIDVSAGNGTYVSTKRFRTITNIDCSDNAAGGGTAWADGTVAVTQPQWGVIWDYTNSQYRVDCQFNFGDGATSTFFTSTGELVVFSAATPLVLASATCTLGTLNNGWPSNASCWRITSVITTWQDLTAAGATLNIYGSTLLAVAKCVWRSQGTLVVRRGSFYNLGGTAYPQLALGYVSGVGTVDINELYVANWLVVRWCPATSTNGIAITSHNAYSAGIKTWYANVTATKINVTPGTTPPSAGDWVTDHGTLTMLDAVIPPATVSNAVTADWIKEQYTCNIHVTNSVGANLGTVAVLCQDVAGTTVFNVNTAADGTIAQQIITYKLWSGTDETLTTYSPHKFTISKAGYQTLVLDAITVSAPIKWHLELQPPPVGPNYLLGV